MARPRALPEVAEAPGVMLVAVAEALPGEVPADDAWAPVGADLQEAAVVEFYNRNPQAIEALRAPIFEEKVIDFLVELFGRRIDLRGDALADPQEVALAFLNLVLGEARASAWGVKLDAELVDRHARFRVSVFLKGLLPR